MIVGAVWSLTVTSNAAAEVLFASSFAVQDTVVVPTGNRSPVLWSHETVGLEVTASLAVTVKETIAPPAPAAGVVIVPGTEIEGAVVSWTVMVKTPRRVVAVRVCGRARDSRRRDGERTGRRMHRRTRPVTDRRCPWRTLKVDRCSRGPGRLSGQVPGSNSTGGVVSGGGGGGVTTTSNDAEVEMGRGYRSLCKSPWSCRPGRVSPRLDRNRR